MSGARKNVEAKYARYTDEILHLRGVANRAALTHSQKREKYFRRKAEILSMLAADKLKAEEKAEEDVLRSIRTAETAIASLGLDEDGDETSPPGPGKSER